MKTAVVTGAAGFASLNLVEELLRQGQKVYGVVRPGSKSNLRLPKNDNFVTIELSGEDYDKIPEEITETCDVFYHMTWGGSSRNHFEDQSSNIDYTLKAVRSAAKLGCKRFVGVGSQAEYGVKPELITEDLIPEPRCAYGASKVAALYLSKNLCEQLGLEWCWGRIFSLYGKYEPAGRMLPDVTRKMMNNEEINMSSCRQNWDYLDAKDGARAFVAIGEKGRAGEIYNVANGDYHELKYFTEKLRKELGSTSEIHYGDDPNPFVSLQVSSEKLRKDTGWAPEVPFEAGLILESYGLN